MQIAIKLYSIFRSYARGAPAGQPLLLELPPGATAHDALVGALGIPEEQIQLVLLNGAQRDLDAPLSEGDELLVFPPVVGG